MPTGIRYRLSDNAILGVVRVSIPSDLDANYDPATEGMIVVPDGHGSASHQDRWRVVAAAVVAKAPVVLTPNVTTFLANGIAECAITFAGLVADATIQINGYPVTIHLADPSLIITSDVPKVFRITLADSQHWAAPLAVRAVQ